MPPSDSPGTSAVAQDATGTVWALPTDYNGDGTLRQRQAGVWVTETVPGAAGFRPRALARGADGAVYAFWQTYGGGTTPPPQCLVTVQRGLRARVVAHFPGAVISDSGFPDVPTLFAGAGGDVWLAGSRPVLWHVAADGTVATFPLKPEQCFGGKLPQGGYPAPTFSSLTDGAGRRWFWQSAVGVWPQNTLRGVLIWDGTALAYHPTLPGLPDRPYSLLVPWDTDHFRLATAGDYYEGRSLRHGALYQVDTRALSAVAETPPHPGAFQDIRQIFQAGGDGYVVDQEPPAWGLTLWRERAGRWQKRLDHLEKMGGYYRPDQRRPWLAEPSGVWLGMGGGAWWLPRGDRPAVWADWRRGVTALDMIGLFPQKDGTILTVGPQGTDAEMPPTPQPVRPLPPRLVAGGMGAPEALGTLVSDPRRHLWKMRRTSTGSSMLDEWDGERWRTHLPPKSITGINGLFACDALGRIWLTSSHWNPPAQPQPIDGRVVYDPARDTWTDYATVADALQAAALPGMAFRPFLYTYQPPLFSGDGRVTYAYNTTIYLFDAKAWRHWEVRQIVPSYPYGNLGGPPHFNADGHLEVALDGKLWTWTPPDGWQPAGVLRPEKDEPLVPPGGPPGLWATPAIDSEGTKWFTWQGAVYTARDGLWAKQADLSAPGSPFQYGYDIEDVRRDPAGRFFFVSRPAGSYDFVVWSPPPVPRPMLAVVPVADDAVTVRFREALFGPHWFRWRLGSGQLGNGRWSAPTAADTVRLTALARGDYRMEAQVLDRRLLSSPPAVAVFCIRVAPAAQIARWVRALLSGPDDAREAAAAGLVKQPDAALPALQAARPGASEPARWWLDAATQQVMEQQSREQNTDGSQGAEPQ